MGQEGLAVSSIWRQPDAALVRSSVFQSANGELGQPERNGWNGSRSEKMGKPRLPLDEMDVASKRGRQQVGNQAGSDVLRKSEPISKRRSRLRRRLGIESGQAANQEADLCHYFLNRRNDLRDTILRLRREKFASAADEYCKDSCEAGGDAGNQ